MTVRDRFLQKLLPYLTASRPVSAERTFVRSVEIGQWVADWMEDQHLPTDTLAQTLTGAVAFKKAIGASVTISSSAEPETETFHLQIDRCPIAGLSRAYPSLCLITCGVLGTAISRFHQPLWASVDKTWAWDDQPCQVTISSNPIHGSTSCRFPVDQLGVRELNHVNQRTHQIPTSSLMSQLASILAVPNPTVEKVLRAGESLIQSPLIFSPTGTTPNEPSTWPVTWKDRTIGQLRAPDADPGDPTIAEVMPVVARIVASCWAEQHPESIGADSDAESRFVSLLVSPNHPDKPALVDQWNVFWRVTDVLPCKILVWYIPRLGTNRAPLKETFQQLKSAWKTSNWFGCINQQYWTLLARTATLGREQIETIRQVCHTLQTMGLSYGMGIGSTAADLDEISQSFKDATEAASFALHHGIDEPYSFANAPGLRLLSYLKDVAPVKRHCGELIEPLKRQDEIHQTSLVATLKTYFACNMSAKKTSETLYIHPGTLKYRLRHIASITGWDLHDPLSLMEVITCIYLSDEESGVFHQSRTHQP